ncbi:Formin-binding protein 1 [Schistosoma japonicum]|nr:Formin-binding protein 1 [Schistosoma japonicum]
MDELSWGVELWDQVENIFKHETDQIGLTESYFKLFSDVQKLEHEFGKKLRKTVSVYLPRKKPDVDELSSVLTYSSIVPQILEMGVAHEASSKKLNETVVNPLKIQVENEKRSLEKQRSHWLKLNATMEQSRKQLELSWQKYVTNFKEKQKAYEVSEKAQNDIQLARVDQQKFEALYQSKIQSFDHSSRNYADELAKYNSSNRRHFRTDIVAFVDDIECSSRMRNNRTREILLMVARINEETISKLTNCNKLISEAVSALDSSCDSAKVIKRLHTDEHPPADLPFLDLDKCPPSVLDSSPSELGALILGVESGDCSNQLNHSGNTISGSGMMSGFIRSTHKNSKDEYLSLRSPFICGISIKSIKNTDLTIRQVADRLKVLRDLAVKTDNELRSTDRMIDSCKTNPKFGDMECLVRAGGIYTRRLNSLRQHIKDLEVKFNNLGGDLAYTKAESIAEKLSSRAVFNACTNASKNNVHSANTKSFDDHESDSSFDSDSEDSTNNNTNSKDNGTINNTSDLHAGIQYVGYASALYEYEGDGNTYLATKPGELYYVLSVDSNNSGWTAVVSEDGTRQGFVPTGYINLTLY